jgi:predicted DNA-binding transcriptional regulator YafY
MARSENQRLKLFYLRDYLFEATDENHTVKRKDIINYLQKEYGISVERKTIYTDIDILDEYGVDIEYDATTQGYKIRERDFTLEEILLLIDSIQSSKFITQKYVKEISDKLKKFASKHERKMLDRRSYVPNRIRNMNESAFSGLDDIHACIANDKKLSFRYFTYGVKKEKLYRRNGEIYIASPYALIWNENNYYLLAFEGNTMKHFRVDKMDNVKPLDSEREGKDEFKKLNLSERSTKVFSMYGGKEERVGLRFSNHLTGVVIDRFGKDVSMRPDGQDHFTVSVKVEISPQFYGWLCGLKRDVRIISPDTIVKEMAEYVSSIAEMYQTEENTLDSSVELSKDD